MGWPLSGRLIRLGFFKSEPSGIKLVIRARSHSEVRTVSVKQEYVHKIVLKHALAVGIPFELYLERWWDDPGVFVPAFLCGRKAPQFLNGKTKLGICYFKCSLMRLLTPPQASPGWLVSSRNGNPLEVRISPSHPEHMKVQRMPTVRDRMPFAAVLRTFLVLSLPHSRVPMPNVCAICSIRLSSPSRSDLRAQSRLSGMSSCSELMFGISRGSIFLSAPHLAS